MRRVVALLLLVLAGGACRNESAPQLSSNLAAENKVTVRPVVLYYEAGDMLLHGEQRNVALPENPAGAMSIVVRELLRGPLSNTLARSFPRDTVVRGVFLLPDGTALVDVGGATLTQGWGTGSHEELVAVYGMVQTLAANFPEVRRVRLLVNGEPADTLAGHVNLERSLTPQGWLVAGGATARTAGR